MTNENSKLDAERAAFRLECKVCKESSTLDERRELAGCCWACGHEIDLDPYLRAAMASLPVGVPDGWMLTERGIWTEEQVESAAKSVACMMNVPGITPRDLAMVAMDAAQCKAPDVQIADFADPSAHAGEAVPVDGVEAPEVVAWMWRDLNGDIQFNYMHPEGQELMTVAQHNRIVSQLAGGDSVSVPSELSAAATDVLAERQRQITAEGWTTEHDDRNASCELAAAAATYATCTEPEQLQICGAAAWPWRRGWWKPTTYRRNLIKAGALILAEIERLDRALLSRNGNGGGA